MENQVVIQYGTVDSVIDHDDGKRILVRLNQDRPGYNAATQRSQVNAFPLLPKTLQSPPKTGEGVLVFTMELGNNQSQRFYIGPIISQPQFFEKDNFSLSQGQASQQAASLLQGAGNANPVPALSRFSETHSAFPKDDSVAIIGRSSEDIELKDGEIDIRCGIRTDPINTSDEDKKNGLFGKVMFNGIDPAYIQLKYSNGGLTTNGDTTTATNSIINMVAGKLNIISTQDDVYGKLMNGKTIKRSNGDERPYLQMLKNDDFGTLMDELHQVPLGDKLLNFLNVFLGVFLKHTHDWNGLPPNKVYKEYIDKTKPLWDEMLSKHVRIS